MKLYEVYNNNNNNNNNLLNEKEKLFIKKFFEKRFYKKHFTLFENDLYYLLEILLKNNIELTDLTEDSDIYIEIFEENKYNEYKNDNTTIINYENKDLLKNIYACDIFRDDDSIPCFDLYFKVFYICVKRPSTIKENLNNIFIQYQIKHFQFK